MIQDTATRTAVRTALGTALHTATRTADPRPYSVLRIPTSDIRNPGNRVSGLLPRNQPKIQPRKPAEESDLEEETSLMLIYGKNYNHETINELPWFKAAWKLMEEQSDWLMGKARTPPTYKSAVVRSPGPLRPTMPRRALPRVRDTSVGAGQPEQSKNTWKGGPIPGSSFNKDGTVPEGHWLLKDGGRNDY